MKVERKGKVKEKKNIKKENEWTGSMTSHTSKCLVIDDQFKFFFGVTIHHLIGVNYAHTF